MEDVSGSSEESYTVSAATAGKELQSLGALGKLAAAV